MHLTKEQEEVVRHLDGPLLVLSPPGSGKTRSLVNRVVNLIQNEKIAPERVLCITFTNKAAEEMRNRLTDMLNLPKSNFQIFTFHGFCNYWLRQEGHRIGLSSYTIMDSDDTKNVIKNIASEIAYEGSFYNEWVGLVNTSKLTAVKINKLYLEYENKNFMGIKLKLINSAILVQSTNPDMSSNDIANTLKKFPADVNFILKTLKAFADYKTKMHMLDFNDLQLYGVKLFRVFDVASYYDYTSVDEIQDSSSTELALLTTICRNNSIVAIGDENQAIYGFRGSKSSNLADFVTIFKADVKYLTINFRSDTDIVDIANDTLKDTAEKPMVANSKNKGQIGYLEFETSKEEVNWITSTIKSLVSNVNKSP